MNIKEIFVPFVYGLLFLAALAVIFGGLVLIFGVKGLFFIVIGLGAVLLTWLLGLIVLDVIEGGGDWK